MMILIFRTYYHKVVCSYKYDCCRTENNVAKIQKNMFTSPFMVKNSKKNYTFALSKKLKSLINYHPMKKLVSFSLFIIVLALCQSLYAQVNTGKLPQSTISQLSAATVPQFDVPTPDMNKIKRNEDLSIKAGKPLYAGIVVPLNNMNSQNSGIWETTEDGYDIWRLRLHNNEAKGCCVLFDKFNLPEGSEFFCYNEDMTLIYGPYTSEDVSGEEFSTGVFGKGDVILEYISPKHTLNQYSRPEISLFGYNFFFRSEGLPNYSISGTKSDEYGASASCMVNINCPEGDNWRSQQKGVARMLSYLYEDGSIFTGWCSGTVVNNTMGDGTPYFLTANHCADNTPSSYWSYFQFYFHYECPYCTCSSEPGATVFSNGCQKIANSPINNGSDFLLVKIKSVSWTQLKSNDIVLNGWSKSATGSHSGVSIHHPKGDVKKISTYNTQLTSSTFYTQGEYGAENAYWLVEWATTYNQGSAHHSVTEQGSSGSPIFNSDGLVVGTLTGGSSSCTNDAHEYYGKISYHWQSAGSTDDKRLKPWLDPVPLSQTTCNALNLNSSFYIMPAAKIFTPSSGNFTFSVYSDQAWTLSYLNEHDWFTANHESGSGNGNIKITCDANNTGTARKANLRVTKTDGSYFNFYVKQESNGTSIAAIDDSEFNIYPNPAHDQIHIEAVNYFIKNIEIVDMLGKVVYSYNNAGANSLILPVSQLENAMYIIRITTDNNNIVYKKFTKN